MTNELEHDNDVQMAPFLAFNVESLDSLWSTLDKEYKVIDAFSRMMISIQHLSYYALLSVGRFNLTVLSLKHLALVARRDNMCVTFTLLPSRLPSEPTDRLFSWYGELSGLSFFAFWFGHVLLGSLGNWKERVLYLLVSYMTSSPLHLQIVLSHFARNSAFLSRSQGHSTPLFRSR